MLELYAWVGSDYLLVCPTTHGHLKAKPHPVRSRYDSDRKVVLWWSDQPRGTQVSVRDRLRSLTSGQVTTLAELAYRIAPTKTGKAVFFDGMHDPEVYPRRKAVFTHRW